MIGLVVVSHGGLAQELLNTAEHVCGTMPQAAAIGVAASDSASKCAEVISEAIARVDNGAGVIVLTDVYGSTPANAATVAARAAGASVVSGVNVPMLIKLACARKDDNMAAAVQAAKDAGQKYICVTDLASAPANSAAE